ncbi:U-box domain-containing protein 4 [Apostasia shenzhenica]|uniref:U-box domain-containing protein 4 n=1 Tax=Apostasia shenzhenica TaxID=1088818 RepID=A0A2I0B721_9ASPA|nr:U-box domain-containing protein 4 [Apostasia shenzhenica]
MTSPSPAPIRQPPTVPAAADNLDLILHHLLPTLLVAALSVKSLVGRWRFIHSKLSLLVTSLSAAAAAAAESSTSAANPLFADLLQKLLITLRSLESLCSRCLDPSLPTGKLHLQSDIDIAGASLSLHLHDLDVLLRSGILHQSNPHSSAIILPVPSSSASRADLALFIRDVFARLQIGDIDLKIKALDSLLEILASDPHKLGPIVAQEGDLSCLVRLLDPSSHSLARDSAAAAVSILVTAGESSRHALFDEGALGPLLRLLDSGSAVVKEKAAAAIEAIAADTINAWAVAAYGGISIIVNACRPGAGSAAVQSFAAASLNHISAIDELRAAIVEEGAIPVLVGLVASGAPSARRNASLCLWCLASFGGEETREFIVEEGGVHRLLQLFYDSLSLSDPEISEVALRAIHALSFSPVAARSLSVSRGFFLHLADLICRGSAAIQLTAAALFCNLSPSNELKRSMALCMAALVKILEWPKPASAQETAARALVSLLAVKSNRKELARDEKSLTRLVQMLDLRREEICQKFPVSVALALSAGGGGGCRRRLADSGAVAALQKLVDAEVPGARKALQRISGSRLKNLFSIGRRE